MKKLTTSFAAATVLATALAAVPPATGQEQTAKTDPFADGATKLEFSLEACTANDFTLAAVYVFEASTSDLKQLGNGSVEQGANKLLEEPDHQAIADEWAAFAKSISAPFHDEAAIEAEKELGNKTLMLFWGDTGGVHTRNPNGVVTVLDEEGPGCAARLALKP